MKKGNSEMVIEELERKSPETIVILGAPGSGKDTQAEYLVEALGYQVISTGELMRILAGHNDQVREMMNRGELIPDSVVEDELISSFVLLPEGQPVILDGYPRNIEQANKLNKILEQNKRRLDRVIYIDVSDDEIIKRISKRRICSLCARIQVGGESCLECGGKLTTREDDKPESVRERIKVFHSVTEPVIAYYKEQGTLVEVDGNPSPEIVRDEVKEVI